MVKNRKITLKLNPLLSASSVSVLLFLLSACASKVNEKDLPGTYIAEYSFGTEKLILNPGGEYIQEISIKDDKGKASNNLSHKGHWKYDPSDNCVDLENALIVVDWNGDLNKDYGVPFDGIFMAEVSRTFRSIRLGTGYQDIDYVKMN